ncbi:MAG: Type phosphodiesterase / nucleotide pyrophosphatase [Nocardioides sp.]|nr:Type phosphodiesterase / nucleotide pyrophosphatase [Nocardioides sp.]
MRTSRPLAEPSAPRPGSRRPRRATLVALVAAALASAVAAALVLGVSTDQPDGEPPSASQAAAERRAGVTAFQVASFNVLGHSHTRPGGNRPGWESGPQRMRYATQLLESSGIDLVGFQEFEPQQYNAFVKLMGSRWSIAPGLDAPGEAQSKAIAWRTADWTLVSSTTFMSPYFGGQMQARPLIQLRHNVTGQLVWVMNTHNPANTRGNAQKHRDQAERIQANLVNTLRRQSPDVPVILLGDMNDRERFYCPVTYLSELESASGGYHEDVPGGACQPTKPLEVDWVMGTAPIYWSGYSTLKKGLIQKTTDHPLVWATATIPADAAARAGVERVVVVDVQGLRSPVVNKSQAPTLAWMRENGASTLAARTVEERTTSLPNAVSMVTGRPVGRKYGGHGISQAAVPRSTTVQRAARGYVASMFDVAHDIGLSTALYSGDAKAGLLTRSWSSKNGAPDRFGKNNGRDKIGRSLITDSDAAAFRAARTQLGKAAPALTFLQLDEPADAAAKYGPRSKQYRGALKRADTRVRRIIKTIRSTERTAGSTMVVVTASGTGPSPSPSYKVPFLVWGPGVIRSDLYRLNPKYSPNVALRTRYSGTQPIRSSAVANLVSTMLSLPSVAGSRVNSKQDLEVFDPALTGSSRPRP